MRLLTAAVAISSSALWADTSITAQYTTGGQTSETTVMSKGVGQRFETRGGGVLILQPDQKRMLQINAKDKTYQAIALTPAAAAVSGATKKGGTVTYETTVTDTGETREIFGYKAKHIKSVVVKTATPDACDPKGQKMETVGWYVDLPVPATPETAAVSAACTDEIVYKQNSAPAAGMSNLGYPVEYTMMTTEAGGSPMTVSMKVTALQTSALADALFDAPAGFQESGKPAAPVVAAKANGATRVGVVLPRDKSLTLRTPINFQDQLLASFAQADVEAVPLAAADADEARVRAKELQCDYVLYSEVSEIKKPAPSKIGGLLKKIPVNTNTQEAAEARVSYQLLPVDGGQPKAAAEVSGKTGGFTLRNAIQVTTTVGMFAASRYYMMMNPATMGMFFQMQSGAAGAASPVTMLDPMMNSLLSLTSRGQHNKPDSSSEAAATSAAMQQVAKGALAALGKNAN